MMKRKKASELFHQVDPDLKVIDGGTHYHKRKSRHLTIEDWERTKGTICPNCGQEALRLVGGICLQCYNKMIAERERKKEDRAERQYYREQIKRGTISLAQMREGRL